MWRWHDAKVISPQAGCRFSSTDLVHSRISARAAAVGGFSAGDGKVSSMYSLMTVDSQITSPSCTSVGTTALGLSFW